MRKTIFILFFIFIFLGNLFLVLATCEKNQININNASKERLDGLYGIGLVKAQAIIDSRPFNSVDNLIKVNGIGNITLNKIKEQNLACINDKTKTISKNENTSKKNNQNKEIEKRSMINEKMNIMKNAENINFSNEVKKSEEISVIKLIPKDIKTEKDNKNLSRIYALFGFIIFCILLVFLFVLKGNKRKSEFD